MISKDKRMKITGCLAAFFFVMSSGAVAAEKMRVTTTIAPLAYVIGQVGGNCVDVNVMIPAGGNPHAYEPTPGQMRALSTSELYIAVGSGLDFERVWLKKLSALNPTMKIVDVSKGIALIPMDFDHDSIGHENGHQHGEADPHIWLSLDNAVMISGHIRDAFIDFWPERKDVFKKNTDYLISRLEELKRYGKERLGAFENKTILIYHPVLGYFVEEFHLRQIVLEHMGKEPTPRQFNKAIRQAQELGIKTVFVSPQFSRKSAEVVAREIKGRVVEVDPLSENYIESMRQVIDAIAESLL